MKSEKPEQLRILYVCGTYAPNSFAGSELSAHELLKQLAKHYLAEVLVFTDCRYTNGQPGSAVWDGIRIQGIEHADRDRALIKTIEEFRPNVIFTQLLWSETAVEAGRRKSIPTVYRIPSFAPNLDLLGPTALVANSKFICEWVKQETGRECHFIFTTIDLERVVSPQSERNPKYITMFNPVREKGGHIFREIAKLMPDRSFATVRGWHSLRSSDGNWDKTVIKRSLESQNAGSVEWTPEDVQFSDLKNVVELEPREQVSEIFGMTKILLVPSQYRETLARVSVEAFANGIPVIASKTGGVQDHVGKAGLVVQHFKDPEAWVENIKTLDDSATFEEYSRRALDYIAKDFSNASSAQKFFELLGHLAFHNPIRSEFTRVSER